MKINNIIFENALKYCISPFWKEFFERCRDGIFPENVKYYTSTNELVFINKKKRDRYSLNEDISSFELIKIFEENGIKDDTNIYINNEKLKEIRENLIEKTKDKKIKIYQQEEIIKFVNEYSEKENLTKEQRRQLNSTITIGLMMNQISSADLFRDENDNIIEVNNLKIEDGKFYIDSKVSFSKSSSSKQTDTTTKLAEGWYKNYTSNIMKYKI